MESKPVAANVLSRFAPPLLLLIVVALCFDDFSILRRAEAFIVDQPRVESDRDFFAHELVLGDEVKIVDWVRRELPAGTAISIDFDDNSREMILRRVTRFWLALLPQYPVATGAAYRICPRDVCDASDGTILQESPHFLLLGLEGHGA